jgi:hypothetical protein
LINIGDIDNGKSDVVCIGQLLVYARVLVELKRKYK